MTVNPLAHRLVENLKALNAKERDHLMRYAYLGATDPYDRHVPRWLSTQMEAALRSHLKDAGFFAADAQCVFAGMDYHLDWLYVALLLACADEPKPVDCQTGLLDEAPPLGDSTLGYLIGIHEDIDLLVVFADQKTTVVLCIEAKGDAAFNMKQLARKLIRLDRIMGTSGAGCQADLKAQLILMGPPQAKPRFTTRAQFIGRLDGIGARESPVPGMLSRMGGVLNDSSSTGDELPFLPLQGFPDSLKKITRSDEAIIGDRTTFTRWRIEPRWKIKDQ